jgi:hypothetical protein
LDGSELDQVHCVDLEEVRSKKSNPQPEAEEPEAAEGAIPKKLAAPDGPSSDGDDSDPENESRNGNRSTRGGYPGPLKALLEGTGPSNLT